MSDGPEKTQNELSHDNEAHLQTLDKLEKPVENPDGSIELSPRDAEAQAEKARIEAMANAVSIESYGKETKKAKKNPVSSRHGMISKQQHEKSFARTMEQVQKQLPASSRIFSKIIHNKAIENTSNIIGNTIARPDAILSGAVVAFVLTLLVYTTAKTIGYPLSGFETIAAFIIGWLIGVIFDYLRVLVTGKK